MVRYFVPFLVVNKKHKSWIKKAPLDLFQLKFLNQKLRTEVKFGEFQSSFVQIQPVLTPNLIQNRFEHYLKIKLINFNFFILGVSSIKFPVSLSVLFSAFIYGSNLELSSSFGFWGPLKFIVIRYLHVGIVFALRRCFSRF